MQRSQGCTQISDSHRSSCCLISRTVNEIHWCATQPACMQENLDRGQAHPHHTCPLAATRRPRSLCWDSSCTSTALYWPAIQTEEDILLYRPRKTSCYTDQRRHPAIQTEEDMVGTAVHRPALQPQQAVGQCLQRHLRLAMHAGYPVTGGGEQGGEGTSSPCSVVFSSSAASRASKAARLRCISCSASS